MNLEEEVRRKAAEIHQHSTKTVVELMRRDCDLHNLYTVLDPEIAEVYRRILPRHAQLCELDQLRGFNAEEKAELAVSYASLYPTFGDEGIVQVTAMWLATRPIRQARNN